LKGVDTEVTSRANNASNTGRERRSKMDSGVGDTVLVNLAVFTASRFRSRESIPCEVMEVNTERLLVRTCFPYRIFTMWIGREWVEKAGRLVEPVSE
jgi:hypothetical protein